jgi:hypothetical protein
MKIAARKRKQVKALHCAKGARSKRKTPDQLDAVCTKNYILEPHLELERPQF